MNSGQEIATDMLRRLLAGERGSLPMHLSMLLEKASPLHNSDDHYRQILPPELANIQVPLETVSEVTATLCREISRNQDSAFIAALSTTGGEHVTRSVAEVMIGPPRQLTMEEYGQGLGILYQYLPSCLTRDRKFLPQGKLDRLMQLLRNLQKSDETPIRRHATYLLDQLADLASNK
jgi:hypothetical protein